MTLSGPSKAFWGIVAGFFVLAIWALIEPKLNLAPPKPDMPDFLFEGVTIVQLDDGKVLWDIQAQKAELFKDQGQVFLKNMEGAFYNPQKQVWVKSPQAKMQLDHSDMLLEKAEGWFEVNKKPLWLEADELQWNSQTQVFLGKGHVKIHTDKMILSGNQLMAAVPIQKVIISQQASARIGVNL